MLLRAWSFLRRIIVGLGAGAAVLVAIAAVVFWWGAGSTFADWLDRRCFKSDPSYGACSFLLSVPAMSDRSRPELLVASARAYYLGNRTDRAHRAIRAALAEGADTATAHYWHGRILYRLDRYSAAAEAFTKSMDREYGSRAHAWRGWSRLYFDDTAALADFDKVISDNPDGGPVDWLDEGRGWALMDLRRYEEALAAFDAARDQRPNNRRALTARARTLWYLGRHAEALEAADEILADGGGRSAKWVRVRALRGLGRFEDSLSMLEDMIDLDDPSHREALFRAELLYGLGRRDEAVAAARDLVLKYDRSSAASLLLIRMACDGGDEAGAQKAVDDWATLNPSAAWLFERALPGAICPED